MFSCWQISVCRVYSFDGEHDGGGLHETVVAADLDLFTCQIRQYGITRCIHKYFAMHGFQTVLGGDEDVGDAIIFGDNIGNSGVEVQCDIAVLPEQLHQTDLGEFKILNQIVVAP